MIDKTYLVTGAAGFIGAAVANKLIRLGKKVVTIDNLSTSAINTEVALGRVVDADYARESINFARQNVLANASQKMLANANTFKRIITTLLD